MVRRMEIEFFDDVKPEYFGLPSLTLVSHREKHFVFNIQGEIDPILKDIAKYKVKNLVFPEPSLEDMFMTFYQKEQQ
ncbi:hypothetical protein ES705_05855 [subsurface metagenome]